MIIDHNRSLPKSGSTHLSTPNKSPSPLPHKPTPQQTAKSQQVHTHQSDDSTTDTTKTETTPSDPLLAMVHQSIHTSDDDCFRHQQSPLSQEVSPDSGLSTLPISACQSHNQQLVDLGANGSLAGSDMRVIHKTHCKINIQGIDNHELLVLMWVTAATLLNTSPAKVIGIFNEYAYLGKGSSIHSSGQLEWFKTNVDEKSVKVGGTQLITTLDGYSVPLLIKDGLAYATSLGKPTAQDMDTYPHVFFTSPDEWDPSVLDHDPPHLDGLDPSEVPDQPFGDPMFDAYGDFNERIIANLNILLDAPPEDCGSYTEISSVFTANLHQSSPQEPDWNALRPFFAWTSQSSIKELSMSPTGMELLHTPRITSKSTLSLAILFSTSPDAVKLLQQTPSSLTLLLLMMVQPWPNSSVDVILLSVMPMASNQPNNSSTPSLITSENGEPWIPSSVMEANMKSPSKLLISSVHYSSKIISLKFFTNTKIWLKLVLDLPSITPTLS